MAKLNNFDKKNIVNYIITGILAIIFSIFGMVQYGLFNNYYEIKSDMKSVKEDLKDVKDFLKEYTPVIATQEIKFKEVSEKIDRVLKKIGE